MRSVFYDNNSVSKWILMRLRENRNEWLWATNDITYAESIASHIEINHQLIDKILQSKFKRSI